MAPNLRQLIVAISMKADAMANAKLLRKLVANSALLLRKKEDFNEVVEGIVAAEAFSAAEASSWVGPEALANGTGGAFDACDLRHWLTLAEKVGVDYIPAHEILALDEDLLNVAAGSIELPNTAVTRTLQRRLQKSYPDLPSPDKTSRMKAEDVEEILARAMDDVPEGWMVRLNRCGSSNLKALAGVGAAGPEAPEVRFGPNLEFGPGWVRSGNRRRIQVDDNRTLHGHATGPGGPAIFLARPWVPASRWIVGEDVHRRGSPLAGKGAWPAEWRAFIENGIVVGVSNYYGWVGDANPETATKAIEVRELAQKMADEAVRQSAYPRYMDIEFVRSSKKPSVLQNKAIQKHLEDFARDKVACTLDFIETASGIQLLEGGPPNSPFGGGHPCAFAGMGGKPLHGNKTTTEGVAFRCMPHVTIADFDTWVDGDKAGCILTWDEVDDLAKRANPRYG